MNSHLLALTITVLGTLCCPAQKVPPAAPAPVPTDAVADAIKKFFDSRNADKPPTELTVELPAPTPAPPPTPAESTTAESKPARDAPPAASSGAVATADAGTPAESAPSLTVQVEQLQTGSGTIDPKTVKLLAPFPAKPLATPPPGWRLDPATSAPPFIRKVDLAPGASITLTIRPHLLVPDTSAFAIPEPGFDPACGYRQARTVSAILANSIQQLDEDAKHLGNAIDQLQQFVSSLPRSAPPPPPAAPIQPNNP
jgi:hypothetical protein